MPLILLAVLVGAAVAIALGPTSVTAAPADALLDAVSNAADAAARSAVGFSTTGGTLIGLLAATLAPGLLCIVIAEAVRAGRGARRKAGAALLLASLTSFAFLPAPQAALLLGVSIPVWAMLSFVTGALLLAPLAGAGAFFAARVVVRVWHGQPPAGTLATLDGVFPLGHTWAVVIAAAACVPVAVAARRLVGPAS